MMTILFDQKKTDIYEKTYYLEKNEKKTEKILIKKGERISF